jgi:hypothetical protein
MPVLCSTVVLTLFALLDNQIGIEGAKALAAALTVNNSLTMFNLAGAICVEVAVSWLVVCLQAIKLVLKAPEHWPRH